MFTNQSNRPSNFIFEELTNIEQFATENPYYEHETDDITYDPNTELIDHPDLDENTLNFTTEIDENFTISAANRTDTS